MIDLSCTNPDNWTSTDHERVYYLSEAHRFDRGEFELAKVLADRLPGWRILITMGPFRGYDFSYDLDPTSRVIHLDCYSPAMVNYEFNPTLDQHPAVEHIAPLLRDIRRDIKKTNSKNLSEF